MTVNTKFVEGADNTFHIIRTSDAEPVVEYAKTLHNAGIGSGSDMKHAAEFDPVVVEHYLTQKGITFREFCESPDHIKAMLNDPSLAHFRIWKGRV